MINAVIYGITLDDLDLEHAFLAANPEWKGPSNRTIPHWIKSENAPKDEGYEAMERHGHEVRNEDLLLGYVFPDGSIDRSHIEMGSLLHPSKESLGKLCYLDDMGKQTLGRLLLCRNESEGWRSTSSPETLMRGVSDVEGLVSKINAYGFDIKPSDLKVIQVKFQE